MNKALRITPPTGPINATIHLPRSKSVANRALVCTALAGDATSVMDHGDADDTRILQRLLMERPAVMHCGLGGTTFRFALAWACVQEGEERMVTGDAPLLARPHVELVSALRALGADIEPLDTGFRVRGRRMHGGAYQFDSPVSSQYLSAVMLVAPAFTYGLRLMWRGEQLSRPYVDMTAAMMRKAGAVVQVLDDAIAVRPGTYTRTVLDVPPDWSAAAFWFQIVALANGAQVLLADLHADGLQGDEAIIGLMQRWVRTEATADGTRLLHIAGVPVAPLSLDMRATPDLFQPLAITCAMRAQPAAFSGLANLRLKESDRLQAVVDALAQLGVGASVDENTFSLGGQSVRSSSGILLFDPRGDHRMAMSLAPLALKLGAVEIADAGVVSKSYPRYWDDLRKAGFAVESC